MGSRDACDSEDCPFCQIANEQTDTEILLCVSPDSSFVFRKKHFLTLLLLVCTGWRAALFSWREAWRRSSLPRCDQEAPRQLQKSPEGRHTSRWGRKSLSSLIDNKDNIWESVLSKLETGEMGLGPTQNMVFRSTFNADDLQMTCKSCTGSHELIAQLWCWATISCSRTRTKTEILAIVTQQLAKQRLPSAGSGWNNKEPRCLVLTGAKVWSFTQQRWSSH